MPSAAARIREQAGSSALVRLWRALLPLKTVVSFLQTGAHPDDEISGMLARLRSDGIRIAYACATRGQGGQNALGSETGADLGVLRTAEMEQAARVLDLDLYWLGYEPEDAITDFGFSKSGEDTLERWGEEHALERMVRAIRTFRPDIICPTFLDVPGQHGHHRAITRTTERAFAVAGDRNAFPEHAKLGLSPWSPFKLYLPAFSGASTSYDDDEPPPPATVTIDTGAFDPVFGATYKQIGEWSRAYHATQGMGRWFAPGPASASLHLRASRVNPGANAEDSLFDGLAIRTLADIPGASTLAEAQAEIDRALAAFPDRGTIIAALSHALALLQAARPASEHSHRVARKIEEIGDALREAALLVTDLTFDRPFLTPGESTVATLSVFVGGEPCPALDEASLTARDGWVIDALDGDDPGPLQPGRPILHRFRVTVPEAAATSPYRFSWNARTSEDPVQGHLRLRLGAAAFESTVAPVEPLTVRPRISVTVSPARIALRAGANGVAPATISASAERNVEAVTESQLALNPGAGWRTEPAVATLGATQERGSFHLTLAPDGPAAGPATALVEVDGKPAVSVRTLAYDHIRPVAVTRPARVALRTIDVAVPEGVRIGHVAGGSDRAAEALLPLGFPIEEIDDATLRSDDLARFDTILVGIFALRARPALAGAWARIKAWVEGGGTLVTLYHRPWDDWDPVRIPMAPLEIGQPSLRWRVANPKAPVEILAPDHPLLNTPNRITEADWDGWVKERGLYFASRWADDYVPLVALADPGEKPHRGALLAGEFGRGRHVHVSLALHTQLDHLVPGAFRLMANILAPRTARA